MVEEGLWDKIIISKLTQGVCVVLRTSIDYFPWYVVQSVLKGVLKPFFSAEWILSSMPSNNFVLHPLNWFIIVSQIKLNKWLNEFRYYNGWVTVIIFFLYNFQRKSSSHIYTYLTVPVGFYILSPEGFSFSIYPRGFSATNRTGVKSEGTAV